jgi:hypothetical protein
VKFSARRQIGFLMLNWVTSRSLTTGRAVLPVAGQQNGKKESEEDGREQFRLISVIDVIGVSHSSSLILIDLELTIHSNTHYMLILTDVFIVG